MIEMAGSSVRRILGDDCIRQCFNSRFFRLQIDPQPQFATGGGGDRTDRRDGNPLQEVKEPVFTQQRGKVADC